MYRATQRLMPRSRRTPAVLILPMPVGPFEHRSPHLADPPRSFTGAENKNREHLLWPAAPSTFSATIQASGFGDRKGPNSMGKISTVGVLRLRAIKRMLRDTSVRRSAQDEDFVGVLTKKIPNKLALMGLRPGLLSDVPSGLSRPHTDSGSSFICRRRSEGTDC